MPSLGEFFNDDAKKKLAEQHIVVGTVIKCFVKNTKPPKEKRFVVLGTNDSGALVGVVFVNTEINWNINRTMELAQLQLFVRAEDNEYLDWDSYIDCSELIELPKVDISTAIINKPSNVLGTVSNEDLKTILDFIKQSPKITPKLLKKFNL